MNSESLTKRLIGISTEWIDQDGQLADVAVRVGRLGEDVSEFALTTLGWIRFVRFGEFLDIEFVADTVKPAALQGLFSLIDASASSGLVLWNITARSSQRDDVLSTGSPSMLKRFVRKVLFGVNRPIEDNAVTLERSCVDLPATSKRLHPMFRDLINTWNERSFVGGHDHFQELLRRWSGKSVKLMRVDSTGSMGMAHYSMGPSGPWDAQVRSGLQQQSLAVVPDKELADAVADAASASIRTATPTLERWTGPLLTSQGVKHYDWYRLTLPVFDAEGKSAVLVGCLQSRDALVA
jgi:hypothetical protein